MEKRLPAIRVLLLTGGPDYHNQAFHYAELAGIVAGEAGADVRITPDLDVLNAVTLSEYQAIINWSTFLQPTPGQVAALRSAVEAGLGLFALHGGAATFWNSSAYLEMLGCRFMRHDPYKEFLVEVEAPGHPIMRGIEDFRIEDELYELGGNTAEFERFASSITAGNPYGGELAGLGEGPLASDIEVLASAEGHPLLYTKMYGKGRVHYNALGHDEKALTHPGFRRLVVQGLAWVAGQDA